MGVYDDILEIYVERERYLLSMDEMLEETLSKTDDIKVELSGMTRTVCCGVFVNLDEPPGAEQFPVCSNNCRKIVEMATV